MRVLLTGPPGIGKTTICKKVASSLLEGNHSLEGFYTEDVRNSSNKRIGFDIIPIKNVTNRTSLARIGDVLNHTEFQKYKVGNYHVFIQNLDQTALPTMYSNPEILIIDEIGKMELFSKNFQTAVNELFIEKKHNIPCIIATIPQVEKIPQKHVGLFDQLRQDPSNEIIQVNYNNRNKLPTEICEKIIKMLSK